MQRVSRGQTQRAAPLGELVGRRPLQRAGGQVNDFDAIGRHAQRLHHSPGGELRIGDPVRRGGQRFGEAGFPLANPVARVPHCGWSITDKSCTVVTVTPPVRIAMGVEERRHFAGVGESDPDRGTGGEGEPGAPEEALNIDDEVKVVLAQGAVEGRRDRGRKRRCARRWPSACDRSSAVGCRGGLRQYRRRRGRSATRCWHRDSAGAGGSRWEACEPTSPIELGLMMRMFLAAIRGGWVMLL